MVAGVRGRMGDKWSEFAEICVKKRRARYCLAFMFLFITFCFIICFQPGTFPRPSSRKYADECYNVYLDVGSNIGVQVRKLFEPDWYPGAPILPIFDVHFGKEYRAQSTCAFGFEPNSMHTQYLLEVQSYLRSKEFRCTFFTNTAAALSTGQSTMHRHSVDSNGVGGSLLLDKLESEQRSRSKLRKASIVTEEIKTIDLGHFIKEHIQYRKIPDMRDTMKSPPSVVIKMDVEGYEYELLPSLLLSGALCGVDLIVIEWHDQHLKNSEGASKYFEIRRAVEVLIKSEKRSKCKTVLRELDDETYVKDGVPMSRHA